MPKLDGYQTTQIIRKLLATQNQVQPKIIALTGHADENYF